MMNRTRCFFLFLIFPFFSIQVFGQGVKGKDSKTHTIVIQKSAGKEPTGASGNNPTNQDLLSSQQVLIVGREPLTPADTERAAALEFIQSLKHYTVSHTTFHELKKHPKQVRNVDLIWFHRPDTSEFSPEETDPGLLATLREYLSEGGSMLLTLDAFRYLNLLGVESVVPGVRHKSSVDEGYGRKLGFHSFREHPVFDGLYGGSYVYTPAKDLTVRVNGFFGDTVPLQGKVVAIDWDYIFFREHSKILVEYDLGGGKVLAAGGYTYYGRSNGSRLQLERFTENMIRYLTESVSNTRTFWWDYSTPRVVPCPEKEQNRDVIFRKIPDAIPWSLSDHPIQFPPQPATSNYCEVAGTRMVVMGKERGGIEECWAHPFMAFRDYRVAIRTKPSHGLIPETILWLDSIVPVITIRPDCIIREYRFGHEKLLEIVTADPVRPVCVIHYEYYGTDRVTLDLRFTCNLRLMWPYPPTAAGTICSGWDQDYNAFVFRDKSGDFNVLAGANQMPSVHNAEPGTGLAVNAMINYILHPGGMIDMVVAAGNEGFEKALVEFDRAIRDPFQVVMDARTHADHLLNTCTMATSPDQNFNLGYRWALIGTDRFRVSTPGMGTALVAGYGTTRRGWDGGQPISGRPGYAWYFGRDGVWSCFAVLDYGDFKTVKDNLEFFRNYQDLNGKIFHEATTSGVVHYDAADATPLFIILAGKYFRHSGDTAFLADLWPAIRKAIRFCFSTDTDGDHLIENTGVGHGWVEGGELYGSHASLYLTGCWAAALKEASLMAGVLQDPVAPEYKKEAELIEDLIDKLFWKSRNGFYSYGLNRDGSFRSEPTILPAVPGYFGVTSPGKFRIVLNQYASNAFSTNWGVRIIREDSRLFNPAGYHYGSVWPLFTGWTALAEYRYGNYLQGFMHIMNNLNIYNSWGLGFVEEVLHGAEYKPSGVCPHQCWSETMVLQPILEGMLGIEPMAAERRIRISPRIPADWNKLTVNKIRVGEYILDFRFRRDSVSCTWEFLPSDDDILYIDLQPDLPPGTRIDRLTVNGIEYPYTSFSTPRFISLHVSLGIKGKTFVEARYTHGISALPAIQYPYPGDWAGGTRIIDAKLTGNEYQVILEGPQETTDTLKIRSMQRILPMDDIRFLSCTDHIYSFLVEFKSQEKKYVTRKLIFQIQEIRP
jgi:glycogen debranching enzyme